MSKSTDPFRVLRAAGAFGEEATERTHSRLRVAELAAVPAAVPTPHAHAIITMWRAAGRQVGVVSNNSETAVAAYMERNEIELDAIAGRTSGEPELLKPSPHLVVRAPDALAVAPGQAILVGDSQSDVAAASAAGVDVIGFANKP
jgi:HAD superfamily hydrolase (TIGR01509 family)